MPTKAEHDALKQAIALARPRSTPGRDETARAALAAEVAKELTQHLLTRLQQDGLPAPEAEYRFHTARRWRFDLAWPRRMLAAEIEGGTWKPGGGRHNRPQGYEDDCEKYNQAQLDGWIVLRFTSTMIRDDRALAVIRLALQGGVI